MFQIFSDFFREIQKLNFFLALLGVRMIQYGVKNGVVIYPTPAAKLLVITLQLPNLYLIVCPVAKDDNQVVL